MGRKRVRHNLETTQLQQFLALPISSHLCCRGCQGPASMPTAPTGSASKLQWREVGEKVQVTQLCPTPCNPMDYTIYGILQARILDPGLPHCRQILYQLSHKGGPRIPEWAACPFSRGSSWPRNQTGISCIAGWFFINWAIGEAPLQSLNTYKNDRISRLLFLSIWPYLSCPNYLWPIIFPISNVFYILSHIVQ